MTEDKVIAFAKENGYQTAIPCKDWNGYACYEPIMDAENISFDGPPLLILVEEDTIRMSTGEEAFQQIDETEVEDDEE